MENNNTLLEPMMPISVAAKRVDVTASTLRMYEREGLIIPHKTEGGTRLYSEWDVAWLQCIRDRIEINKLNIAGLRRLLAMIPCWEVKNCSGEEQKSCQAYLSNDNLCWNMDIQSDACKDEDCRICPAYLMALKVDELKNHLSISLSNISKDNPQS